jgi:hypothetical protein
VAVAPPLEEGTALAEPDVRALALGDGDGAPDADAVGEAALLDDGAALGELDAEAAVALRQIFGWALLCKTSAVAAAYARSHGLTAVTLDGDTASRRGELAGEGVEVGAESGGAGGELGLVRIRQSKTGRRDGLGRRECGGRGLGRERGGEGEAAGGERGGEAHGAEGTDEEKTDGAAGLRTRAGGGGRGRRRA